MEGKYYWVPVCRVLRLEIEKPTDLRDLVWAPSRVRWTNGGEAIGHIPVRYPGTLETKDNALLLGRGLAYPAFYGTLPASLRQHLAAASRAARSAQPPLGIWGRATGDPDGPAEVADLAQLQTLVLWPKLFRVRFVR